MDYILLGRIFAFMACIVMVSIGYFKTKKAMVMGMNVQFILFTISYAFLGGTAAVVSNIVSLIRNIISMKWALTIPLQIGFIGFQGVFTYLTTANRWIDWLPFMAAACITLSLGSKSDMVVKIGCILSCVCFSLYDFNLENWVVLPFDLFSFVTAIIGVFRILKDNKKKSQSPV
ncbi:MAG: YgjV family protein [Pseudobutyrivibrio sp.]|nr:YgjV family protein [Pseudobutyrivibrio sp.]